MGSDTDYSEEEEYEEEEEEKYKEKEEDNNDINKRPLKRKRKKLWSSKQEEMLINTYKNSLSVYPNISQKSICTKLSNEGTLPFTGVAILGKLSRLLKDKELKNKSSSFNTITNNNTTKTSNSDNKKVVYEKDKSTCIFGDSGSRNGATQYYKRNTPTDTVTSQAIKINQLEKKLQLQQQQIQQQSQLLQLQPNQKQSKPLNNITTNTNATITNTLDSLPVNKDTQFISSNSAIIIKSSTSLNNQDVYVLFPAVAGCESEIKSVKTINGRHHVEIEMKSKTFTHTSFHYITQFDPCVYHDAEICKIRYNQVESNGLLFKKREIATYNIIE